MLSARASHHCTDAARARARFLIPAGGVHWAERCPRECPRCRPPFGTLLSSQLECSSDACGLITMWTYMRARPASPLQVGCLQDEVVAAAHRSARGGASVTRER